ncbi:hypothetical protein J6590_105543 [Homalodisca vitripennis]|nr:hypothetical protein J6590_105543 [Homalodisca vitripennis]
MMTTDQLFSGTGTGTGYCSERSDCSETRLEKLTVFWLFSVLHVSPWLANSPTFGRVPVSAVSGTGAASLPGTTKKWNARALPALLDRHPTGV